MKRQLITHTLAALAGFAVFWLGFGPKGEDSTPPTPVAKACNNLSAWKGISERASEPEALVSQHLAKSASESSPPGLESILGMKDPVARLDALTTWAQNLASQGAAGAEAINGIKNKVLRMGAEAAFYSTLAEQDAMLAFQLAKTNGLADDNPVLGGLFQGLAMVSPGDAASAVDELPPGSLRSRMVSTVAGTWAELNLKEALAWASTLNPVENAGALATIFEAGAAKSPESASAAALALSSGKSRYDAIKTVGNYLSQKSPEQAMLWADTLQGSDHEAAVRGILTRLSSQSPELASQWLDKLPVGKVKRDLTQEIVGQMALNDPQEALRWLEERGETDLPASVAPVLWVMSESDPAGALAAFSGKLGHPELSDQAAHLAEALVRKNGGRNAMNSVLDIPDGTARQAMVEKVAREWALADPNAAWDVATKNPELLGAMIPALSSAAPGMVTERLKALPPVLQEQSAPHFAVALAETDLASGAALLDRQNGSDPAWDVAINTVSSAWASLDPSSAANASLGMKGPAAEVVRAKAVEHWLYDDVTGACSWIKQLPQGKAKDGTIAVLVQVAGPDDPQGAMAWLPFVSDPQLKASLQNSLNEKE